MSRKKDRRIVIEVHGIEYPVFAKVKWQQFLGGFSFGVALLVLCVLILAVTGRIPQEMPTTALLVLILVLLAVPAAYRGAIQREYRRSGFSNMELSYEFDSDGWAARSGTKQARVLWCATWKVRRNANALLLYPNRKSVNLVPLKCISSEQQKRIINWCTGKK